MNPFKKIKTLYKPLQPTALANSEIIYNEIKPGKIWEDFVYCFWELKTEKSLENSFNYRVVSDGCIDVFFEYHQPAESFVMGFCRKFVEFEIGKSFHYFGIRFLPSAFPLLFDINAETISNTSTELKTVLPQFSSWISRQIFSDSTFEQSSKKIENYLKKYINNFKSTVDERFINALIVIFEKKGFLNTETGLNTGLSPRQLRRIFNFYIGTTPKAFSNVVRFQYVLNKISDFTEDSYSSVYYEVGFFDQAHFIKNFKTFYGVTPSEALG